MRPAERTLFHALSREGDISPSEPVDLAEIFVLTAFLASLIRPLQERLWLFNRDSSADAYARFLKTAFRNELAPLGFVEPLFANPSRALFKGIDGKCRKILSRVAIAAEELSLDSYQEFIRTAMRAIADLNRLETSSRVERTSSSLEEPLDTTLYRTFDGMDELLGLDYGREAGMKMKAGETERLYEGAGVGVQTSYATFMTALEKTNPAKGARVIDLGSGYGRFGFVIGLLRPDIQFTGYEYVAHRVEVARASAARTGIGAHVRFVTQDLADSRFELPEAEVYYMYDPFTESTYRHVIAQLKKIARRLAITVVTKGNAGDRFMNAVADDEGWMSRERYDGGTLSLFRSRTGA